MEKEKIIKELIESVDKAKKGFYWLSDKKRTKEDIENSIGRYKALLNKISDLTQNALNLGIDVKEILEW